LVQLSKFPFSAWWKILWLYHLNWERLNIWLRLVSDNKKHVWRILCNYFNNSLLTKFNKYNLPTHPPRDQAKLGHKPSSLFWPGPNREKHKLWRKKWSVLFQRHWTTKKHYQTQYQNDRIQSYTWNRECRRWSIHWSTSKHDSIMYLEKSKYVSTPSILFLNLIRIIIACSCIIHRYQTKSVPSKPLKTAEYSEEFQAPHALKLIHGIS